MVRIASGRLRHVFSGAVAAHVTFMHLFRLAPLNLSRFQRLRTYAAGLCAAVAVGIAPGMAWAQSVVFINPGKSDEAYWVAASHAMQKAADSLGMQLQVMYGERNRLEPIAIAQSVAQRKLADRPDYVIFSNDYGVAPSVLRTLEDTGIKVFMAFSGPQSDLREQTGQPRERFKSWLGSLEPNAEDAGYLTAKALIQAGAKNPIFKDAQGKLQLLAIAGDRSTTSSIARNRGMHKAVSEAAEQVELQQEVYGEWRRDKAQAQAEVLYKRYPQARLIWSGNDLMAFGAMQSWQTQGGTPGKDALFSGVNTSIEAFEKLRSGQLTALAGGHFLAGAWAMVMLYDYHHGVDFISEGLELHRPMFTLFDARSSMQFEKRFNGPSGDLNFRMFSKHLNPKLRTYDFDLQKLLR